MGAWGVSMPVCGSITVLQLAGSCEGFAHFQRWLPLRMLSEMPRLGTRFHGNQRRADILSP